ncbi:MAG: aminotransferase class I/II-fold pyridoxal phosphate-dependent enzyme [Candidatus Melainabacteria bacterium]|nr:aminotransferase class I/II-fold pyridoxal phosphate-dependent enzyme [Candidatus Melainabacteria bacterium]
MTLFADRISELGTENAFKIGPHIAAVESAGNKVIRLNLGEPDFNLPEFVKYEIKRQLDLNNTHYCDPKGLLSLRLAIAKQMRQMRGLDVSPERVVVFPGGKPSIGFCQEAYCNRSDEVIYPSPGFPIYESFTRYVGASPVPMHLKEEEGFTVSADRLAELITKRTKLIILNFPSNPTGGVASREQLEALADVIKRKCSPAVRIYSDEIYEYIVFDGRKHVSIASLAGMEERTIVSSGFSKTFAWTGGRIGYAVFPSEQEANVFKNLNINYFSCIPPFNQEGARLALEHPDSPKVIEEMVKTFQTRRDVIVRKLNQIDGVTCRIPGGAFYLFPNISGVCQKLGVIDAYDSLVADLRQRTSPSAMFQMFALYNHHVAVMDRNSFGKIGADGEHYLRLSIASDLPVLEEGVRRLEVASRDHDGFENFVREHARDLL